jgi:hypothetical protein
MSKRMRELFNSSPVKPDTQKQDLEKRLQAQVSLTLSPWGRAHRIGRL